MSLRASIGVLTGTMVAAAGLSGPADEKGATVGQAVGREIRFAPDRVYEVTGIWLAPENLDALNAYFEKVFPIAARDYSVKPLFSLEPQSAYAGDFTPLVMFVNEWPSLSHFEAFVADPRAQALFPERDAIVSRLVVTHYSVAAPVTLHLGEGELMEFAAMWVKPGSEDAIRSYYDEALPVAIENGARPITPLTPLSSYRGDYLPTRAGLNLWTSPEHFDAFLDAAASLIPLRDRALDRLDVTHAKVRFDGAK